MKEPLLAGIDVGGTSTRVALANVSGRVQGEGRAPGAGLTEVSLEESAKRLSTAWREACARAKHDPAKPVAAVFAGFGAFAAAKDEAQIRRSLKMAGILARVISVGHDSDNAQAGARPAGAGVHVIAGTGSVVAARDERGKLHRVGGWGPGVGDEGAAWWIANEALRALVARQDAWRALTALDRDLLRALKIREPRELLAALFSSGLDRAGFAALAQPVLKRAATGDRLAQGLLAAGAKALGEQVALAASRAGLDSPVITVSGGMFDYVPDYGRRVAAAARSAGLHARLTPSIGRPLAGSVLLARRLFQPGSSAKDDLAFVQLVEASLSAAKPIPLEKL